MTPARAQEIIAAAQAKAVHGPWCDQLDRVMTFDERREVIAVWETMPGYTNFVSALFRIARPDGVAPSKVAPGEPDPRD